MSSAQGVTPPDARGADGHQRIAALDGVRGLAILFVMGHHFLMTVDSKLPAERFVLQVLERGWVGVDLFFVLSGFLITGILWDARTRGDRHGLRNFYVRRMLRISPLYYATLLGILTVGLLLPAARGSWWERFSHEQAWCWLYSVNIARDLHGKDFFYFEWFDLSHFWTLAVEEHFYLIWPWVVLLSSRRRFLAISVGLLVGAVAANIWACCGASGWPFALTASLRQSGSILIGSLLAVLMKRPETRSQVARATRPVLLVAGAASAFLLIARPDRGDWPMLVFGPLCLGSFFAAAVAGIVQAPAGGRCRRFFESRPLHFFGKHSYSLYIFHHLLFPVWLATIALIEQATGMYRLGVLGMLVIATGSSIGISLLTWRFLEQPILEFKKYFEPGRTPEVRVIATAAT